MEYNKEQLDEIMGTYTIWIMNPRTGGEVFIEDDFQSILIRDGEDIKRIAGAGIIKKALNYYLENAMKDAETFTINTKQV